MTMLVLPYLWWNEVLIQTFQSETKFWWMYLSHIFVTTSYYFHASYFLLFYYLVKLANGKSLVPVYFQGHAAEGDDFINE